MSNLLSKILGNISTRIMFIIYIIIILLSTFFVMFGYFTQLSLQEERQYDKLQAIVTSLAINIDGDEHFHMMEDHPNEGDIKKTEENVVYHTINDLLKTAVKENDLNSPMYTMIYNEEKDLFYFGVTSDENPYFRHEYKDYPKVLLDSMEVGGTIPKYEDEHGVWLSAFHPIKNSNDKVVGVLQADVEFDYFIDMVRSQYLKQALMALAVIIIIALVLIPYTRKILKEDQRQKELFILQKKLIEEKNKDITDSINYALKIQNAILPSLRTFEENLTDSFVYYKSKDIVAGDFYWFEKIGDDVYFAAADCTGHGVPGAMVSVICSNALHRVVSEMKISDTGKILDHVTDIVIQTFEKSGEEIKDGMDICFCKINMKNKTLQYSGANNPLYFIRDNAFESYKPDKQPIGKYDNRKPFTSNNIDLKDGDCLFLFTDGFADQFGGEKGKKLKYKPFKELLLKNHKKPMQEQLKIVDELFENWKGDFEQIDDVCVIGVRI